MRSSAGRRRGARRTLARAQVDAKQAKGAAAPARPQRSFLAPELAAGLSNDEAPEFSLKMLLHDPKIRDLGLRLWRQFSGADASSEREFNAAGLSFADLWKPGVTEKVTTSSTQEELTRYRGILEYRAKFLEALLEETLADLERTAHLIPAASGDPAALSQAALPDAQALAGSQGGKAA